MHRHDFLHPGSQYGGVALWMLNDALEPDEVARQLAGLKGAGWGAVITRTFNGLRTRYLSEEWMDILTVIVDQAKRLEMKVWFQAGYMPSAIPDLPPTLAHRTITRRARTAALEDGERVLVKDKGYVYVEKQQVSVLDLLSPEAVDVYVDEAYTKTWLPRFGEEFGRTIEAVWVDEPHFRPPLLPWSSALPDRFRAAWGYDLVDAVPALFGRTGNHEQVRHHYWRVVGEMLREAYFARVREWCRAHDVMFSGHLMGEDTLNNQIAWTGAAMPCYEYMQLPGIDHLTMSLTWPSGKSFILTPKQCSSAAHQLGKDLCLSEMYAVSSQGITFEDRKQIAEWLMVLGINYRCYHGAFYSLRGRRKRIYPPHLSHQQPWWPENERIATYFQRLSYALQQGTYRPEVLVLHPVESAFCLYDTLQMTHPHDRTREPEDVRDLDTQLVRLCEHLLSIQRSFEFGDESQLATSGEVGKEGLSVGHMTYSAIILPDMITIRASTAELLRSFVASGGKVIAVGQLPTRVDGWPDDQADGLASLVDRVPSERAALRAALHDVTAPDIELVPSGGSSTSCIWVHGRTLSDGRLYYLHNTSRKDAVDTCVRIRGTGRLECWDLRTGEVSDLPQRADDGCTATDLHFPPLGSHLLLFRENERPAPVATTDQRVLREFPILGRPRIVRHDPNALTLDLCRCRKGAGPWSERLPVLTIQEQLEREPYRGPIDIEFTFQVEHVPPTLRLVIEDAAEYRVTVNGQAVAYEGLPHWIDESFHPTDIAALVHRGENVVELSAQFQPMPRAQFALSRLFETREGSELEAIYLVGDFAVKASPSPAEPRPRCVRMSPDFRVVHEPHTTCGDLVSDGYPFYAGRLALRDRVALEHPAPGQRVVLSLPGIDAAALARVRVNGAAAGDVLWPPYEVDITHLVRQGENEVEVELVSTLRNLLGPHHRPGGEPDQCWDRDFALHPEWLEDAAQRQANWTDDYFFLRFGLAQGACIRILGQG